MYSAACCSNLCALSICLRCSSLFICASRLCSSNCSRAAANSVTCRSVVAIKCRRRMASSLSLPYLSSITDKAPRHSLAASARSPSRVNSKPNAICCIISSIIGPSTVMISTAFNICLISPRWAFNCSLRGSWFFWAWAFCNAFFPLRPVAFFLCWIGTAASRASASDRHFSQKFLITLRSETSSYSFNSLVIPSTVILSCCNPSISLFCAPL